MNPAPGQHWPQRWQRFSAATVRGFHSYANWLVGITWKRFVLLAVLLLISTGILQNIPPFSWSYTRVVSLPDIDEPAPEAAPSAPQPPASPDARGSRRDAPPRSDGVEIIIDDRGVRITPRTKPAQGAASAASAVATDTQASAPDASASVARPQIDIRLPAGETSEAVREAIADAKQAIEAAVREAQVEIAAARAEAEQARAEGRTQVSKARRALSRTRHEVREVSLGEFLPSMAMLWIVASLIIKISYKRQRQAEAQAAQAVETAEAESLRRQVVEARMAAMQAQVEPHFLFNTLASIDHLIEVDPPRASQMQKNLIALLRASMPTMREASDGGVRHLGRELAVIRPYLEILKVRMEERLDTTIDLPDGLLSAEFPPMMLQTLVENAIKHGLEPKPEGGRLSIRAEIVHGKLAVSVADTGLGFGRAASSGKTAGTGVGLANIRERLQLLYGNQASLTIIENPGGGTKVTLAVPYNPVEGTQV